MQSEELSAGQVLCEVLISTEMIKIRQWKFPQVGGGRWEDQSQSYHRQ